MSKLEIQQGIQASRLAHLRKVAGLGATHYARVGPTPLAQRYVGVRLEGRYAIDVEYSSQRFVFSKLKQVGEIEEWITKIAGELQ